VSNFLTPGRWGSGHYNWHLGVAVEAFERKIPAQTFRGGGLVVLQRDAGASAIFTTALNEATIAAASTSAAAAP